MFPDFSCRSAALYERACRVLPGGNTRTSLFWPPYPIYAVSASGSRVTDADGVERLDFQNNFTSLIHGHAHPVIVDRVREQVGRGASVGLATEAEIALAELLCARVPSFEAIRFANSGTEACMNAVKAARAYTGRPKYAKCEGAYHGSADFLEVSISSSPRNWGDEAAPAVLPESRHTPAGVLENVVVIPFNNAAAAERILSMHTDQLAAVMIDPMPVRCGMVQATGEFLDMVRRFTRRSGALLIFDEVLNFRLGYRGAQSEFGIEPDLTALGKIIGGGFPVGAITGRKEVMAVFDPRNGHAVWHGGTFNGNPVTMVAGLACMELMTPEAFHRLNALGELARRKIREAFAAAGVPGQVTGRGSLFRIHCTDRVLSDYRSFYPSQAERERLEWLMRYLLNNGILMTRMGTAALSTVLTEADVGLFADTLLAGLLAMKREDIAGSAAAAGHARVSPA